MWSGWNDAGNWWIVSLIGKDGKYNSTLSPCGLASKFPPSGGSNPSIGDVSSVGCVLVVGLVLFFHPAD